ncbi:MAG TPA: CHAD domain-containing protein [Pyrinomonadaceae bacterium]|nr:CHAD domain-containing protein [Pyrinomonadaceae bacterium]
MKAKRIPGLDCSAPADQMIRLVLRTQLRTMCNLRARALDWSDPEGVHEMRVLSRRMRSAISDFEIHLRKPGLPVRKLRAIAKSLGVVRDEDVALAALEALRADASEDVAVGIDSLLEERRQRQTKARADLMKAINSTALRQFQTEFQAKVRTLATVAPKTPPGQSVAAPTLTFRKVGARAIAGRLKDFRAAVQSIYFPFEIDKIHQLRILAKRLRYAVELFRFCWGKDLEETAQEIAGLQTSLGELHDCDVWIEYLGKRLKRVSGKEKLDPESLRVRAGYIWLLRHFSKKRTAHYRSALARWQQWETNGFLDELKLLIRESPVPQETERPH